MVKPFNSTEIERLRALRETLVGIEGRPAGEPAPRYWDDAEALRLYDAVFARRIEWKWDAALDEALERGPRPLEPRTVLDFGAGTGAASRALLRRIPAPERLTLVDRDARALAFARESIEAGAPGVEVEARDSVGGGSFDLALVSHVLDELDDHGASALVGVLRGAESILWVEPGSKRTSRRLSTLRAELLDAYDVVAPCTHVEACGVLDPKKKRDWCHFFAKPPAEVHTTAEWTQIGRELRIDLRSLPYAFLFLVRRPEGATASGSGGPRRVLGRPRVQRGRVMIDLCGPEGTSTEQLQQRDDKALYKALKKDTTILRFDPR